MRIVFLLIGLVVCGVSGAGDLSVASTPYLAGGFFMAPVLPTEGREVVFGVRASCAGIEAEQVAAEIWIHQEEFGVDLRAPLELACAEGVARGRYAWTPERNGLYAAELRLDPDNLFAEADEANNTAKLVVPVLARGIRLHFPWYREAAGARWSTCITSVKGDSMDRLEERGVLPLNWEYGGMSWSYYDKERAKVDPEAELAAVEELFYTKFCNEGVRFGFGIDEVGGYPGSWKYAASVASLKGLVRARASHPGKFYAVWNGGGLRHEIANLAREGADLLLLETYIWRGLPGDLGASDIYQAIQNRLDPYVRETDMFQPAYGNACSTLLALDTSERPDQTDLGEFEQVIRFIRRRFPEMRGIAYYNGGYGGYGLEKSAETDRQHAAVLAAADQFCLDYFIRPCVTLARESLWWRQEGDEGVLTLAVSNYGGMDSGPVMVQFLADGEMLGTGRTASVPAGSGRTAQRRLVRLAVRLTKVDRRVKTKDGLVRNFKPPVPLSRGFHEFEARIRASDRANTVLDARVSLDRYIP